jgi:hypothetical protein
MKSKPHSWTSSIAVYSRKAAGERLVSYMILRRCVASQTSPDFSNGVLPVHYTRRVAAWMLKNHVSDLENVGMESLGFISQDF